jgi:hypothetical protein
MTANVIRKVVHTTVGFFLLTGSLMALPAARPPDAIAGSARAWDFQSEAADLLQEVRGFSSRLSKDADQLESYTRSNVGRPAHGEQLALVKEHVNLIGERLERLQEIQHVTSPWQQQAIGRITPVAVELASRTQAAIEHLNGDGKYLFSPIYADHLSTIAEHADTLQDSVSMYVEYGETQQKLDELKQQLEIRSS